MSRIIDLLKPKFRTEDNGGHHEKVQKELTPGPGVYRVLGIEVVLAQQERDSDAVRSGYAFNIFGMVGDRQYKGEIILNKFILRPVDDPNAQNQNPTLEIPDNILITPILTVYRRTIVVGGLVHELNITNDTKVTRFASQGLTDRGVSTYVGDK